MFTSASRATLLLAILPLVMTASCKNAVDAGHNTALDSVDLVKMTDDMAARIATDPDVIRAYDEHGPLKIVVQPVENQMTAEVLPRGPAEAFTARVRTLLARHAPQRFTWVMNRDAFYRLRNSELEGVDLGPDPSAVNPEYALTAKFESLTKEDPKRRSVYYLCIYELTNLNDRTVLWNGAYEVKKVAVKGFLD
jgi:hypothetical protein